LAGEALSGEDVVLVDVTAEGKAAGRPLRRTLRIIDQYDHAREISAMARMTGYPAAIIATMLATGEITSPGAHPQELVVPANRFRTELARRDIRIQESEDPLS